MIILKRMFSYYWEDDFFNLFDLALTLTLSMITIVFDLKIESGSLPNKFNVDLQCIYLKVIF